jgi:small neutral amino acid transporter SnatA (MarC family)
MVVGALLPIVDPLSSAPVYLQVTADVEAQSRSALLRSRLSAFLLLCVGVQIAWNGLHALLANLLAKTS